MRPTRRSVLRSGAAIASLSAFGRPHIANADAKTATVWWVQGFVQEEDISIKQIFADYEKASGNTLDYSIIPFAPHRQKVISAITSGDVPDLTIANPAEIVAIYAYQDKLVDVSDVVDTQKKEFNETALLSANSYNAGQKKRSYYGVPLWGAVLPFHVWKSLVEKAGHKIEDIPNTWDARWDFFKDVHKKLRDQGMRNVYGLGLQVTTNGVDPNNTFHYFLSAYGGKDLVTKDGKFHGRDPQIKEAVIKALTYPTTAFKDGFVPSAALNWNDADDNNAFHSKLIVADIDGTISTEVAMFKNKDMYDDAVTMGLGNSNDGKPIASQSTVTNGIIPKGAKNEAVAKDFLKYIIQPKITNDWLKVGLGRNVPVMPSIVKNDPWWFADPHRKAYTTQALLGETIPAYWAYNPAYAEVQNTHVFPQAWAEIIRNGMSPDAAADQAFKQADTIFAKYPIATT
jgi:multiple sugar transport system substrate-binding protein